MGTRVFISYAKEDTRSAERLYVDLQQAGVAPWLDSSNLIPGQDWEATIKQAIDESSYFIALLSSRSVGKKGHVQKEIRHALAIAEKHPEDKIFIIPIRLDECEPSFASLRKLHRTDLFPSYERGLKDVLRVFNYRSEEKPTLVAIDTTMMAGTISGLRDSGFGFIRLAGADFFFHHSELRGVTFDELHAGDCVTFALAEGPKGPVAVTVERT